MSWILRAWKAYLGAFGNGNLEQLVYGFFVVQGVHDGQVDDPSKIDKVGLRAVLNALF